MVQLPVCALGRPDDWHLVEIGIDSPTATFREPERPPVWKPENQPGVSLAFTPDGTHVVAGPGLGGGLNVWSLTGALRTVPRTGVAPSVEAIVFGPGNGDCVCAEGAGRKWALRLWDLETGTPRRDLSGHSSEVTSLAVTLDRHFMVSGSLDRSLLIWNLLEGRSVRRLTTTDFEPWSVAIMEGARRVFAARPNGPGVDVWTDQPGDKGARIPTHEGGAKLLLGRVLTVVEWSGMSTWDPETLEQIDQSPEFPYLAYGRGAAISPDGRFVAIPATPTRRELGRAAEGVGFWDLQEMREVAFYSKPGVKVCSFKPT